MAYELSIELPSSPARVWRAWTHPDELSRWLCQRAHVDLRRGGAYELFWDEDPNVDSTLGCTLLEALPYERLRFEWQGKSDFLWMFQEPHRPVHVEVRLQPGEGGTRVTITQLETRDLADWRAYDQWMAAAWQHALDTLEAMLRAEPPELALQSATPLLIADAIEPCLPFWETLGFKRAVEVPGPEGIGFVILARDDVSVMLQSRASLTEDLPALAHEPVRALVYLKVNNLDAIEALVAPELVVVPRRTTFYGAHELGVREPSGGVILFAEQGS